MSCPAIHPERAVECEMIGAHAEHVASIRVEGTWKPEHLVWPNEEYVPPTNRAQQAQQARQTAAEGAKRIRAEQLYRRTDPANSGTAALVYVRTGRYHSYLAKVAELLLDNLGQWLDAAEFDPFGRAGERRMRDLRDPAKYGWPIETRRKPGTDNVWQHRLASMPTIEDRR